MVPKPSRTARISAGWELVVPTVLHQSPAVSSPRELQLGMFVVEVAVGVAVEMSKLAHWDGANSVVLPNQEVEVDEASP